MFHPPPMFDYSRVYEVEQLHRKVEQFLEKTEALLQEPAEIDRKRRYPIKKAAAILGISPRTLKRRANAGRIHVLRDGKRRFVSGAEILRYSRECGGNR